MEAMAKVAKITRFAKVSILRLTPTQNQQGPCKITQASANPGRE